MPNAKVSAIHSIGLDWRLSQSYVADAATVEFLRRIRDDGRPFGRRCSGCHRVLCPARAVCEFCACKTDRWVELGTGGELRTLTVAGVRFDGFPEPPYAFGFVQLDGAATCLLGFLDGRDWSELKDWSDLIGSRCSFVPRPQRVGDWLDFSFTLPLPLSSSGKPEPQTPA